MKQALAELLIRRTELKAILARIDPIRDKDLYEVRVKRVKVEEGIDEVTAGIPKTSYSQIDAAWNYYSRALRRIDALIQRTNWDTSVEVDESIMNNYAEEQA